MNQEQIWWWSSPVGLGVFFAGLGAFLWSIRAGSKRGRRKGTE